MKSNNEYIRKNACDILLQYRALYRIYNNKQVCPNDETISKIHDYYIMLRGVYFCGLLSRDTINRSYYMYITIKYKRR